MSQSMNRLVLASASPRRRELLAQLGLQVEILPIDLDESIDADESAAHYVQRLARAKAQAGLARLGHAPGTLVLGADTAVVIGRTVLGKPADRDAAMRMLAALSGRSHRVLTAVAVCSGNAEHCELSETEVEMRPISEFERNWYWDTGEPRDKAGAYAIQGLGAQFVSNINGSYSGVVGLPLFETAKLLRTHGIELRKNNE